MCKFFEVYQRKIGKGVIRIQIYRYRKPPNLEQVWFPKNPHLRLQESTLKNLKNCPKLKNVGLKWSNLDGISAYQLQEFNKHIALFIYHDGEWVKFENLGWEFTIYRTISHAN